MVIKHLLNGMVLQVVNLPGRPISAARYEAIEATKAMANGDGYTVGGWSTKQPTLPNGSRWKGLDKNSQDLDLLIGCQDLLCLIVQDFCWKFTVVVIQHLIVWILKKCFESSVSSARCCFQKSTFFRSKTNCDETLISIGVAKKLSTLGVTAVIKSKCPVRISHIFCGPLDTSKTTAMRSVCVCFSLQHLFKTPPEKAVATCNFQDYRTNSCNTMFYNNSFLPGFPPPQKTSIHSSSAGGSTPSRRARIGRPDDVSLRRRVEKLRRWSGDLSEVTFQVDEFFLGVEDGWYRVDGFQPEIPG